MKPSDTEDGNEFIKWECPDCGEDHEDQEGLKTHCRKCGLIVIPYDGFTRDEGEYVCVRQRPFDDGVTQ